MMGCDEVLDANLPDFSLATAFLLGTHLRRLCTADETTLVMNFFDAMDEAKPAWRFLYARAPSAMSPKIKLAHS